MNADLLKQIDKMADDYLSKVRSLAGEQRKEQLNNIQKLFNQSKKFGDEKVQLALQTYEMVSICIHQGSHASSKVLESLRVFLSVLRHLKVLENHLCVLEIVEITLCIPGKYWNNDLKRSKLFQI